MHVGSIVPGRKQTINTPVTNAELGEALTELTLHDQLHVSYDLEKDNAEFVLKLRDDRGQGYWPSFDATRTFPGRFPERREVPGTGGTVWRVPVTDISAQLIHKLWPADQLTFDDDAKIVFDYTLVVLIQQVVAMQATAEYHEYIKWRDALGGRVKQTQTFDGCGMEYEWTEAPQGHALSKAEETWRLHEKDRLFASEDGLYVLHYPTNIAPPMHLGSKHEGMLHQSAGGYASLGHPGYGLFFEPGTGKTGTTIWRIDKEAEAKIAKGGTQYHALIVVPNNIALNWENEFKEFSNVHGSVTVLRGLAIDRIKMFIDALQNPTNGKYVVMICSYELLINMWDWLGSVEWDLAVLDESHYIKWPYTKRAQYAFKLRDKAKARLSLTGTPVCNTPIDLYSQFEFLQKGGSGFSSFKAFQNFYGVFEVTDPKKNRRKMVDVQNLPFMKERIARMAMCVSRDEALPDLPEIVRDVVEVFMSPEQRKIYDAVATQLYAEIENDMANATDRRAITADNILTKLLRLAQVTSGFVAYDAQFDPETGDVVSPKGIDRISPNPKIEALMSLFKDEDGDPIKSPDQKTIVWACWKQDIKTIAARLTIEGIDCVQFYGETHIKLRQEAERRFNCDPKCTVFVGNPGCGGVGLNLIGYPPRQTQYTTNCDHVIYFSQDWSHPKRSQSEMRANRLGTRVVTRCTDLCVRGTIDEEIRARVLNKRQMAAKTQDLREVLDKVLGMVRNKS